MSIISSLLDTDLYKFTMQQVVFHQFMDAVATYSFKCRNPGLNLAKLAGTVRDELDSLGRLPMTPIEIQFLRSQGLFAEDYLSFLSTFRLNSRQVTVAANPDGTLSIDVAGPWLETIPFEVPLLAIVNELYFRQLVSERGLSPADVMAEGRRRLAAKIDLIKQEGSKDFFLTNFGERRRFSRSWLFEVDQTLNQELGSQFIGTSCIESALHHGLKPSGTMAHEFLQAAQVLAPSLEESQTYALRIWLKEYGTKLGIALSDVFGFKAFRADFGLDLASSYAGARHDSGDPFLWGEELISHYQSLGIDPRTKTGVFSDGLDIPLAIRLVKHFSGRLIVRPAVGTNLTNDMGHGLTALNIVMKMTALNGLPVAKVSDAPGKTMCADLAYLDRVNAMVAKKVAGMA